MRVPLPTLLCCAVASALVMAWLADAWALVDDPALAAPPDGVGAVGLALGFVLAGWSYNAFNAARRLGRWSDLEHVFRANDRLDSTLYAFAALVRSSQGAGSCIVALDNAGGRPARLYTADGPPAPGARGAELGPQLRHALLALPAQCALLYERPATPFARGVCRALDVDSMTWAPADEAQLAALANLLEARAFVSLPLRSRGRTLGRVDLVSRRRYGRRAIRALAELMARAAPLVETLQLAERLDLTVARHERQRISRDLHDGTVQPYVGLKLGLEALRRRMPADAPYSPDVDEIVAMACDGIKQLRDYVGRLNSEDAASDRESLVHGVRFQAHRFSQLYPIETRVMADGEIEVRAALYEEVVQMVREGLSNVRRHTRARRASVELSAAARTLSLRIVNDSGDAVPAAPAFLPRSISARARELGGHTAVGQRANGDTVVAVELPL